MSTFHRVTKYALTIPDVDGDVFHRVTKYALTVPEGPGVTYHRVTKYALTVAEADDNTTHRVTKFALAVPESAPVEIGDVLDVVVETRWDNPANKIRVFGAEDDIGNVVQASASDSTSQTKYGVFEGQPVSSSAIANTTLAQAVADAIISERSTPERSVKFVTTTDGLRAGQLIEVHIPSEGILNTQFLVTRVSAGGLLYNVELGEARPRAEELLKKIEAAFRRQRQRRIISIRCFDLDTTQEGTVSDTGDTPIQDLPNGSSGFAVSAWIFPHVKNANMDIMGKGDPTGGSPDGWVFRQLSVEGFELRMAMTGTQKVISSEFGNTVMDVNQWHHVYIDDSGVCFVNGVSQGPTGTITNPGSGSYVSDVGQVLRAGTNFDGCLADLRIYDQRLGERAIKELATEPFKVRSYVDPVVWWKLDDEDEGESSIGTSFDYSGNKRTATWTGNPTGTVLQHQAPLVV